MAMEKRFVGWRYFALVGGLVGMIGLAMYPIAIDPYLHPEKYRMYLLWKGHQFIINVFVS